MSFFDLISVAHEVFGIAPTINAANYVYFLALQKVLVIRGFEIVSFAPERARYEYIY